MTNAAAGSPHSFHIPVMGTGFMIDAPLRVAKYGISSVLSLVDDVLIEQMRKFHCQREGEPYSEIAGREEDARARRITAYLDLLDRLVRRQVAALRASPFEPGSEITRYFELLPDSPLRREYRRDAGGRRLRRTPSAARAAARPGGARKHRREHHGQGRSRYLSRRRKVAASVQRRFSRLARFRPEHAQLRRSCSRPA